jgi:hypothetical protein
MNVPNCLFADIIVVDDRPTIGGGLPDFWEATFARLFNTMNKNKNIDEIFVLGDVRNGEKTISKLKSVSEWEKDIDTLASKIGVKSKKIQHCIEIIKNNVHYVNSSIELLKIMSLQVNKSSRFLKPIEKDDHFQNTGFLKRQIDLTPFLLNKQDGIKVKTIAEAFPLILDIARDESQKNKIRDQAGEMLGELIDFKVQLTDPSINTIPDFYLQEKGDFEHYFQTQFLTPEGLFGKHFELKQKKAVIKHIVKSISNPRSAFATRRAVMVIPHEIINEDDISPLGLISVRIIPRFTEYFKIILSYSFTWRTVEALVGFPYSIYGSVKFAEHLTQEIKSDPGLKNSEDVRMGEVFYVAHSLHIFTDDYGQAIAKKIIDEASI